MSSDDDVRIHHGVEYNTDAQLPTLTLDDLRNRNIEYIRILWVDLVNHVKSRTVPINYFEKLLRTSRPGTALAKAALGIVFLTLAPGFGPTGEYLYALDMSTLRVCPHLPGNASVLGYFEEKVPPPLVQEHLALEVDSCPRTILRRAVEYAKSKRVEFLVGFETEFILLKDTLPIKPVNPHGWCDAAGFPSGAVETRVLEAIARSLKESEVELQMFHSEAAPGQYEVITGPLTPLQAVDALVHTRDVISNVASRHGLRATLAPRVFSDNCGSAAHTHISIHSDKKQELSLIHDDLSYAESTFLAGLLKNLPGITLLSLPTTESYKRMVDGVWSGGTYVCWGVDNREAPIRLCNASSPSSRHFEIKCLDGTANPYVAVAAFIYAGMEGVLNDVECQIGACNDEPAALIGEENRSLLGITQRMPLGWEDARKAFHSSDLVENVFGSDFKTKYLAVNKTLIEQMTVQPEEESLRKWVETY